MEFPYSFDVMSLDKIFSQTVEAVEKGQEDIAAISDAARQEYNRIESLLNDIRRDLGITIDEVDKVEHLFQRARLRLMQVSKGLSKYSEDEIREAYDTAHEHQIKLITYREKERELKKTRDELERTSRRLKDMVERSEKMASQVGVAIQFLKGNLEVASQAFLDMQQRYHYGVRVVEAQEEERKRLAREIHDGPSQSLANIVLRADYCQRLHQSKVKESDEVSEEILNIKKLVQDILVEMRQIIFNLRPMTLDDLGLVPALERFVSTVQKTTSSFIEITTIGEEVRLPSHVEIALFRMAQESINNAIKHSGCDNIFVKVEFTNSEVFLVVKDDGFGFDLEAARKRAPTKQSFGLLGMEERIKILGGNFGIESLIGSGTRVWAKVSYGDVGGDKNGR